MGVFDKDAKDAKDDLNNRMEIGARDRSYYGVAAKKFDYNVQLKDRQGRNVMDHTITHRPPVIGPADYGDE